LSIAGYFMDTVDFGGGPLASAGSYDAFVLKLSGVDGSHLWSSRFGGTSNDLVRAISVDASGDATVIGSFHLSADFGGGPLTSAGRSDVFVVKLSGVDGSHLWSERFGGPSFDDGWGVAVDTSGNATITGEFQGTVNFGGASLVSAGGQDAFVVKLSGLDGSHLWSERFGGSSTDSGRSVAEDVSGNAIVTGSFRDTVDFGGGALTSAGGADVFVVKLRK
jgi:hypothetical protein